MVDHINELALARGVRPGALREALEAGDARLAGELLGLDREQLQLRLDELRRSGVRPCRAAAAAVLGA